MLRGASWRAGRGYIYNIATPGGPLYGVKCKPGISPPAAAEARDAVRAATRRGCHSDLCPPLQQQDQVVVVCKLTKIQSDQNHCSTKFEIEIPSQGFKFDIVTRVIQPALLLWSQI